MPVCFQYSFGKKVTVIIDCFEVFFEKPSNLLARAQTFSNYKHHNTIKILIGITPQGSISFVSESQRERTSDKFLTENCGLNVRIHVERVIGLLRRKYTIPREDIGDREGIPHMHPIP